jgi:hypothetical protein
MARSREQPARERRRDDAAGRSDRAGVELNRMGTVIIMPITVRPRFAGR